MQGALAKNLIFLIALSLVVPESYARRLGSGNVVVDDVDRKLGPF